MPTPPGACRKCGSPLNGYGYDLSGYMHDPDSQACLRVQLTTLKDANARLLAVKQAAERVEAALQAKAGWTFMVPNEVALELEFARIDLRDKLAAHEQEAGE
jgi:hypothetical protein